MKRREFITLIGAAAAWPLAEHARAMRVAARALIWIKFAPESWPIIFFMERAEDLARVCTDAVRRGEDFPTVWHALLKSHPLIDGLPRQRMEGKRSVLEIRLITGERLVFDGDAKRFSVG